MNKKIMIAALAMAGAVMTGCDKDNKSTQPKSNGMPKANAQTTSDIAIVDVDSLQEHYKFFVDEKTRLEALNKQYQGQLQSKLSAFQKAQGELQQKMQRGEIKSEDEYNKAMQRLQNLQAEGQKLEEQLAKKLADEQEKFKKKLHDTLNEYIQEYNKDGRYSLILTKSGDNVLYAAPAIDITAEITDGLNKRYKAGK